MGLYIVCWLFIGSITHFAMPLFKIFKEKPKTTKYDSKEVFKAIDNLNLSKPIELENVPIEEVEVEYIHSIKWCASSRQVIDIEYRDML